MTEIRFHYGDIGMLHADSERAVGYVGASRRAPDIRFVGGEMIVYMSKKQRRNLRAWLRRNPDLKRRFKFVKYQQIDR